MTQKFGNGKAVEQRKCCSNLKSVISPDTVRWMPVLPIDILDTIFSVVHAFV
jgi:hypothetical protein